MIKNIRIRVTPEVAFVGGRALEETVAEAAGLRSGEMTGFRIRRRSIDARQRNIVVDLTIDVYVEEPLPQEEFEKVTYPDVSDRPQVVVIGAGPAGLFAALRLIELRLRPVVLERGQDVHTRKKDIARISREHVVDAESNFGFGEGGAGAFSDGKLFTRSKKRGSVEKILRVFCQMGANPDILRDAHPHLGTDRLPAIIEQMRLQIICCGGEVRFGTRVDTLLFSADHKAVVGVVTAAGTEVLGPVILATGHSARDVYRYLLSAGVSLEAKGIAMGVRVEHPSALIDRIQYHSREGRGAWLPAAEYSFLTRQGGRGVYSFCMCPGGVIVPAATAAGQVVVNGMSPAARGGRWSNSGMVVETLPDDVTAFQDFFPLCEAEMPAADDPLRVMALQEAVEHMAWVQGGSRQTAPAQRMTDFVNGRLSATLPDVSYTPGTIASPIHFWLPAFFTTRLQGAFKQFGKRSRGFLSADAVVLAPETRTSAPVRILRQPETLQSAAYPGLYPCGEGAGYAGGIVSAAIDGERCAEAVAQRLAQA
ncbi:MAG: FAD-binding protein [Bacteroidaceae bacterium]|nr:FAD-binding protein [Bacteroidaceae bacterium]